MEDLIEGQLIVCRTDNTWYLADFDSVPAGTVDIVDWLSEKDKLPNAPDIAYIGVYNYELSQ